MAPDGLPASSAEWRALLRATLEAGCAADMETFLQECISHPQLCHYKPPVALQEGRLGINSALHSVHAALPNTRAISRLLCGGQGLRGADPVLATPTSTRTACLYCLTKGHRRKETLQHFVFQCPLTAAVRLSPEVAACWAAGPGIFELHRNIWSWRQIRCIREALSKMLAVRDQWLSCSSLSSSSWVQLRLSELWDNAA